MEKLKWIRKPKNPWMIDFILGTWMGCIILSVTGFSLSRRNNWSILSFYYSYVLFVYFLGLCFSRNLLMLQCLKRNYFCSLLITTSAFCSASGVNMFTGIDTFLKNERCYKAVTSCQRKNAGLRAVKRWNWISVSLWQQLHAGILCQDYLGILFQCWIIWLYSRWGESSENLVGSL